MMSPSESTRSMLMISTSLWYEQTDTHSETQLTACDSTLKVAKMQDHALGLACGLQNDTVFTLK